jgi:hypothetical protein
VQTLVQQLPHAECGLTQINDDLSTSASIHVTESFGMVVSLLSSISNSNWMLVMTMKQSGIDEYIRTLGGGLPSSMSELHAAMVDLYNYCSAGMHNI